MTPTKYNVMNELLAEFSELNAQLATIEAAVNRSQVMAARPMLPDHANTKARLGEIEAKLRSIAEENPELFADDKKSHQTPFGAIAYRKSSYLDFEDEEKVVLKIQAACEKEGLRAVRAGVPARFTAEQLLRTVQHPNLEALENLSDTELAQFGIERKTEEKFSVKPLEVKADKLQKQAQPAPNVKPERN